MVYSQAKTPRPLTPQYGEQEGIIVWDQKGLVVLWPDGHCSRFSWALLRQICQCSECQKRKEGSTAEAERLANATAPSSHGSSQRPRH